MKDSNKIEKKEKKKKGFDLFAESSESEESDEDREGSSNRAAGLQGFLVHNPSVDNEGYYLPKSGEIIQGKYKVLSVAGKGVFSCVVKAVEITKDQEKTNVVAIKIMRTKFEVMRQSGLKERDIVSRLN